MRTKRRNLEAYLIDHLTGSDAAFRIVTRLKDSDRSVAVKRLAAELCDEFAQERSVVEATVRALGQRPVSPKRAVGGAAGRVLEAIAGGDAGDLALFRTLESLAIGVQGKRLLWRALGQLALPSLPSSRCHELEALAVDQWTRIEHMRLQLVKATFANMT
ncbi:MAG TPA: hypothetical protein VM032_15515 [Vicinamibacterales bacterium]|nr:hypothetical protein [Vicinamibacterales bacterium]